MEDNDKKFEELHKEHEREISVERLKKIATPTTMVSAETQMDDSEEIFGQSREVQPFRYNIAEGDAKASPVETERLNQSDIQKMIEQLTEATR